VFRSIRLLLVPHDQIGVPGPLPGAAHRPVDLADGVKVAALVEIADRVVQVEKVSSGKGVRNVFGLDFSTG
jgi:hypothetical protein